MTWDSAGSPRNGFRRFAAFASPPLPSPLRRGFQEVREADPTRHLRTETVEHGEPAIGAIPGRIIVDPEGATTEGRRDQFHDLVGDRLPAVMRPNPLEEPVTRMIFWPVA